MLVFVIDLLPRHNAKPRLDIQKRENVEIALEFMKKVEKIRLENIGEWSLRLLLYMPVYCEHALGSHSINTLPLVWTDRLFIV